MAYFGNSVIADSTVAADPRALAKWNSASRAWLFPVSSLVFIAVLLLSSMYCTLAYIPTTYFAFVQAPFQSWLPAFTRLQPFLFLMSFAVLALSTWTSLRLASTRTLLAEFLALGTLGSVALLWLRPLQFARNSSSSFVWALAFLLPIICLGTIDYQCRLSKLEKETSTSQSFSFFRVVLAAIFVGLISPGAAYLRYFIANGRQGLSRTDVITWGWSVLTHVLLFIFVFSIIEMALVTARQTESAAKTRFLLFTGLAWLGLAIAFYKVVLSSIPFAGAEAILYAAVFSLSLVLFAGGWVLRRRFSGKNPRPKSSSRLGKMESAALVVFLIASAVTVPALIGVMDWNAVLEKTWSMVYWAIACAIIVRRYPRAQRNRILPIVLLAILSFCGFRLGVASQKLWSKIAPADDFNVTTALEQRSAVDASFAAANQIMSPGGSRPCNDQCKFIHQQTDIPASAPVNLHNVDLVQNLQPATGKKPNIFIVVVDSLRQDYVSAYNPAVWFTPAIGAFAKDSVVFRNAFTRYSGTTLAEPSIWSGTLLLHKHYVQPFHLVNNLEKLSETDGYQNFVSTDTVLRILLQPSPDTVQLDANAQQWTDLDFCSTAAEAMNKISSQKNADRPIFLYTQPQNIHIVTLGKTSSLRPARKTYAPFVPYYASELERVDGCFGNFVQRLKAAGLYENSIIVLTADHGEALDTLGAERHAFSLKPAIIRIPLIIHVPQTIRRTWYHDADAIAFNTDITPTLYELLGHGPVVAQPEFGRPLFTPTAADMDRYRRDSFMIASSYGPLYGLLQENGQKLFIENENTGTEEFFDLQHDPGATHSILTEQIRHSSENALTAELRRIADLYGYKYKPGTIIDWLMR